MKKQNFLFYYPFFVLALILVLAVGVWLKREAVFSGALVSDSPKKAVVAIYGDSRFNHDAHRRVVAQILKFKPDAVFHVGDLVDDPKNGQEWAVVKDIISPLQMSSDFLIATGNHEQEAAEYYSNFVLPGNEKWYSYDISNVHFLVFNTNLDTSLGSEQYQWAEQDLKLVDKDKLIVAVTHHPFLSVGRHAEEKNYFTEDLNNLLTRHQVELIFSGHEHNYERLLYNNINYIITGGGGAPLYEQVASSEYLKKFVAEYHFCLMLIGPDGIEIKVFNDQGKELDHIVISN